LFPTSSSRRVRPSLKSLILSMLVVGFAAYTVVSLLDGEAYLSLMLALVIALGILAYRNSSLQSRLPEPHGRGRPAYVGVAQMRRTGVLMVIGGILVVVIPIASVSFLPPLYFFTVIFGIIIGFPSSEVLFFLRVNQLETRLGGVLRSVTEESDAEGEQLLIKTVRIERTT
jgi:hypothetical protein